MKLNDKWKVYVYVKTGQTDGRWQWRTILPYLTRQKNERQWKRGNIFWHAEWCCQDLERSLVYYECRRERMFAESTCTNFGRNSILLNVFPASINHVWPFLAWDLRSFWAEEKWLQAIVCRLYSPVMQCVCHSHFLLLSTAWWLL